MKKIVEKNQGGLGKPAPKDDWGYIRDDIKTFLKKARDLPEDNDSSFLPHPINLLPVTYTDKWPTLQEVQEGIGEELLQELKEEGLEILFPSPAEIKQGRLYQASLQLNYDFTPRILIVDSDLVGVIGNVGFLRKASIFKMLVTAIAVLILYNNPLGPPGLNVVLIALLVCLLASLASHIIGTSKYQEFKFDVLFANHPGLK